MRPSNDLIANLSPVQQAALDWHARRNSPNWTLEDEQAFAAWLAAEKTHGVAYARWEEHDRALSAFPSEAIAHLRGRLAIDKARLGARQENPAEPTPAVLTRKPMRARIAVAVLAGMVGGIGLVWHHQYAQPLFAQSYATARGEMMTVSLPDGSRLQLDTATEAHVVYYRKHRQVSLKEGQAMFSVTPNRERPFQVTAGETQITVLGTRFSVRHTPSQPGKEAVQVAVEEGRVRVNGQPEGFKRWLPVDLVSQPGAEMIMGQQLAAQPDGTPGPIHAIAPEAIAPWREHRLAFVNTPLGQAIDELNRYSDIEFVIRDPHVAAQRISGTFDPRNLDALKRILPSALPVRVLDKGDKIEIVSGR